MSTSKQTLQTDPRAVACELAKVRAGGYHPLAKQLGVKRQVVYGWKLVPPKYVLDVERLTGVSRHHLRPEVFGPAPDSKEAAA